MSRASGPDPERPRLGRARDWLLGALVLAALLVAVDRTLGWPALLRPWATLPPGLLAAALALTAASSLLRALRVQLYFRPVLGGRFAAVARLSLLHNAANNLLPMRAGELVFPWLMRRYFGYGLLASGASLLWIRLMDLHVLGLLALLLLWLRAPAAGWAPAGWLALAAWLGALALLPLLRRIDAAHGSGGGRLRRALRFAAAAAPSRQAPLARLYLATLASWGCKLLAFSAILAHFVPADEWRLLAGVMGAELSSVLPVHGIAGTGSYELAAMAALVPLGVAPAAALAGAVNLHLFVLGATLLSALAALLLPRGAAASRAGDRRRGA